MYRMLSVCLILGFLFGEVTNVKNEIKDVKTTIDSELKKPRGEENTELNELKNVRISSDSEHSITTVDEKTKKFKKKHDRSKDEVAKRNTHSIIPVASSQSNTNKNLENYFPSAETLIQKDKQPLLRYGIEHTPQRFRQKFLEPRTRIKNFYLTGQDIVSAGVGGGLFSGVISASAIQGKNLIKKVYKTKPKDYNM